MCEIYTASKEQRLRNLIRKYSILANTLVKCPHCLKKFEHRELLAHYQDRHTF